jgi:hypothetical protein
MVLNQFDFREVRYQVPLNGNRFSWAKEMQCHRSIAQREARCLENGKGSHNPLCFSCYNLGVGFRSSCDSTIYRPIIPELTDVQYLPR